MEVTQQRRAVGNNWQKWSSTRRGTFAIAGLVTILAAAILALGLHKYREGVHTPAKTVSVLVANRFIEKGTSGAAIGVGEYFHTAKLSEKTVAQGALLNAGGLHGQVASTDIYPGQQLTASDFVGGGLFYSRLPASMRAVSVPVDSSHGMIGNIQTGDRADVYASFKKEAKKAAFLRLVAPDAVVLDAGHGSGSGGLNAFGSASTKSNAVLEVNPHQAAELAFASDFGKVWLVLSPAHGTRPGKEVIDELSILVENEGATVGGAK
jgi:Flp pilus assembly protein CpaB